MELHKLDAIIIFFTHHRPRQPSGCKGLTNAWSPLQDDVLLILKHRHEVFVAFLRHKYLFKEIILCVFLYGFFRRYRIRFSHNIKNKIIFLFCQSEQTALCILKILHLLQLRARLQYRIINWRSKTLHLFKQNFLSIIGSGNLPKSYDLFYWVRLIADNHVTSLCIQKVLKDAALVSVLIIERIRLRLTDSDTTKTPNFRIGIQPPISRGIFII